MKFKLSAIIVTAIATAMWFVVTPALATSFTINGVLPGNVTFSGKLNINTQTGLITGYNVPLPAIAGLPAFTFTPADSALMGLTQITGCPSGTGLFGFDTKSVSGFSQLGFFVIIPKTTLVGFTGAAIIPSVPCNGTVHFTLNSAYVGFPTGGQQNLQRVNSGSISTVVPEPTAIVLLGTGLLSLVGAARKRSLR